MNNTIKVAMEAAALLQAHASAARLNAATKAEIRRVIKEKRKAYV